MTQDNQVVRAVAAIPIDDLFDNVTEVLARRGMKIDRVRTGSELLAAVAIECPDIALVYDALPDMSGERAAQVVRDTCNAGVIMLSKHTDVERRATALESCVDDYVTVPAHNGELFGRVAAVLRRRGGSRTALTDYSVDGLSLDFAAHLATVRGRAVELTPTEWSILRVLALYQGVPVPSEVIGARVWGADFTGDGVRLRVHLSNIRKKIEPGSGSPRYVITVPRRGIRLASE